MAEAVNLEHMPEDLVGRSATKSGQVPNCDALEHLSTAAAATSQKCLYGLKYQAQSTYAAPCM